MADAILTLNAGSSSIKFALFRAASELPRLASGAVENIGNAPHLIIRAGNAVALDQNFGPDHALSHEALLGAVLHWVEDHLGQDRLLAVGHRIVHGGTEFFDPVRLDAKALSRLAKLNALAPLHEPHNLAAVHAAMALRPHLPQIGCFDTAFHQPMPEVAARLALPRHFHDEGVRRYGFHGLSYEYIASRLREVAPHLAEGRVIAAHLGNGASLCAMQNGVSINSTMGFTALDGLVMGTRCGALDPGAVLYLLQSRGMTAADVSDLLYRQSGLLGVSGLSADVRTLLVSLAPEAAEALELFAYNAAKHIASLCSALGGLDGLGVCPGQRRETCRNRRHLQGPGLRHRLVGQ